MSRAPRDGGRRSLWHLASSSANLKGQDHDSSRRQGVSAPLAAQLEDPLRTASQGVRALEALSAPAVEPIPDVRPQAEEDLLDAPGKEKEERP